MAETKSEPLCGICGKVEFRDGVMNHASDHNFFLTIQPEAAASVNRCIHGVWLADHCHQCPNPAKKVPSQLSYEIGIAEEQARTRQYLKKLAWSEADIEAWANWGLNEIAEPSSHPGQPARNSAGVPPTVAGSLKGTKRDDPTGRSTIVCSSSNRPKERGISAEPLAEPARQPDQPYKQGGQVNDECSSKLKISSK